MADNLLRELLRNEPDPFEAVAGDQTAAMPWKVGFNAELMMRRGRLAVLECGHFVLTKALRKAKCRRCGEMIRAGYDYDAFRNLGAQDTFSWPDDPLRELHEGSNEPPAKNWFSPV